MTRAALALTDVGLLAAALGLATVGGYMVGLLVLSRILPRRTRGAPPGLTETPRIAVLVVAHDEELSVANSIQSLGAQSYPQDRFRVFCVADRCTDRTAQVARDLGATVLERGPEHAGHGKAFAVEFGVDTILASEEFDALAVFDADNTVDQNFLGAVATLLRAGERVVQGVVDAQNPSASWVAASSALGFWALSAVNQEPRGRLGLSCPLMGTGFAMGAREAARYLRGAESLTDDLELGARLALDGLTVAHAPDARTLDEKPVRIGTATAQRNRWMQGRFAVAGKYVPRLLSRAAGRGVSLGERARAADVAFQLVAPSLLFTGVALALVGALGSLVRLVVPHTALGVVGAWPALALLAAAIFYVVPIPGIARFRPPAVVWLAYAIQPLYLALSFPLALTGWLGRRGRDWKRTEKGTSRAG